MLACLWAIVVVKKDMMFCSELGTQRYTVPLAIMLFALSRIDVLKHLDTEQRVEKLWAFRVLHVLPGRITSPTDVQSLNSSYVAMSVSSIVSIVGKTMNTPNALVVEASN